MSEYVELFLTFAQVGVCTFGGGYAMLPILQREVVEKKGWVTAEELADYFAIGQCTPGVIAVNTATFVGAKRKGSLGGVVATLGMVFPSIVIITLIAAFLRNFAHMPNLGHAFAGVRRERETTALGRSIGDDALKKATAVLYTNLLLALAGAIAICAVQPLPLVQVLFETFSAIGTAGMTMGITRDLLPVSRLIIVFLMYCGRVGSISFAVALLEKKAVPPVTLPREDITIG